MATTLTWHGHSCFQINCSDCNIIIDPFFTGNPKAVISWEDIETPDVVLITHAHVDHVGDAVNICKKFGSSLGAVVGIAEYIGSNGVASEQILNEIGFNIGGSLKVNNTRIRLTEAFHTTEVGACTGYIITLPSGYTVYHAGDTGIFANMAVWGELYPIDLALLPIGDVFTMDARQAACAAKLLQTKTVIPMHYGTFPVLEQTPDAFFEELSKRYGACHGVAMIPGDSIALP